MLNEKQDMKIYNIAKHDMELHDNNVEQHISIVLNLFFPSGFLKFLERFDYVPLRVAPYKSLNTIQYNTMRVVLKTEQLLRMFV